MSTFLPSLWASDRQWFCLLLRTRLTNLKELKIREPYKRRDDCKQEGSTDPSRQPVTFEVQGQGCGQGSNVWTLHASPCPTQDSSKQQETGRALVPGENP